ncbi:MAG: ABC transporter permease [Candidatus Hadarchaeia archaeon]
MLIKQRFYTFLLMGIVVGFTAILYIGRMGSYKADYGTTYELFTIAAVTIGGTALYGGKGRVWGAYFGALIFAIVTRAIIYLGIGFRWQQVFTGLLILIGVTMYYAPLGREEEGIPG